MMRNWTICISALLLFTGSGEAFAAEPTVYERKWSRAELEASVEDKNEWLGSDLGRSRYAPAPWTPMEVEGQEIRSWGKVYRYEDSLLPVSMTSLDQELIAGRPVIRIRRGHEWIVLDQAEVTIHQEYDGEVGVKAVASKGGLVMELSTVYEFDGMGKVVLTLSGESAGELHEVLLDIPLQEEQSVLFHYAGSRTGIEVNGEKVRGAALPPMSDSGEVDNRGIYLDAFREILWFGNRDVGFSWFADGMHGWPVKDEKDIQVLGPLNDGVRVLTLKLADQPFQLDKPLEIVFGVQATPMKPRSSDFRARVGWSRNSQQVFDWMWRWGDGYYYPFHETHPEKAREHVESARAQGREVMPCSSLEYFGAYRFSRNQLGLVKDPGLRHREVLLWGSHWDQLRQFPGSVRDAVKQYEQAASLREQGLLPGNSVDDVLALDRHTAPGEDWDGVLSRPTSYPERFCYNSSFQDFYLWKLHQLVEDTGLAALYLDQQLYQCADPEHGCGYVKGNGDWGGQGNVFAMREMMKRMYFIFYELNDHTPPQIMWHCSQQMVIPAMSFIDIFWDGEKYVTPGLARSIVGHEFYSEVLDEAVMQVQHTGKQFGFIADFLPQLTRAELRNLPITSPTSASARDMMGLLMIHDSHIDGYRALTYHSNLISNILNKRSSFPLGEMDVVYYWEKDRGIRVNQEAVKPILHHKDGQALLILFNWGDETLETHVELDWAALGYTSPKQVTIKDAFSDQTQRRSETGFVVDLLPRDFRMLDVQW